MPFPINYCLVCEGARPEVGGKLTILGFFGVTPNVDIGVARLDLPVNFMVVLGFSPVQDTKQVYNHSFVILNPDGSILVQSPQPSPINIQPGKGGIVAFGGAVVPNVAGPRTVRLIVNGQTVFEDRFTIRKAKPDEIAGLPGAKVQ